jgi:hypothetical protein
MLRAQTARQEALRRCTFLSTQLGSNAALVDRLIASGLSESWIRKFIFRHTTNPTIDKLDQLLTALDDIEAGEVGG